MWSLLLVIWSAMYRVHHLFICWVGQGLLRSPLLQLQFSLRSSSLMIVRERGALCFSMKIDSGYHERMDCIATHCNTLQHTATHGKCVLLQSLLPSTPTTTNFVYVATAPCPCNNQICFMTHSPLWNDWYVTSRYEHAKSRNVFIGCPFIVDYRMLTWNANGRI